MRELPQPLSDHLRLLGLVGAVMVVFIHSTTIKYGAGVDYREGVGRFESLLSHNMFHSALLVFFMCSSFLLFAGEQNTREFASRLRRRFEALVVPYLAWSTLWFMLVLLWRATTGGTWPGTLTSLHEIAVDPIPGHLWFLRDLIVLVGFSWVIRAIPRRALAVVAVLVLVWWLFSPIPTVLSERTAYEIVSNEAICSFLIGVVAARMCAPEQISVFLERRRPLLLLLTILAWIALPFDLTAGSVREGVAMLAGAAAMMLSLPWLRGAAKSKTVQSVSSYGFIIYLAHHPAIGFVNALLIRIAPSSQVWHLLVYVGAPLILIFVIVLVFDQLRAWASSAVAVLNGGRPLLPLRATQ
jgi:hypothetical protein